jgi:glyoxylase-like metal-dependent hydrolase (beta-lactamase superfamily II)
MELDLFVTPGLGDNSYVLSWGDEAAAIDPQRDVERFVEAAAARGALIRYVIETHVHNDYVSGAAELRAATGAEIWPRRTVATGSRPPIEDGMEIAIGDGALEALATPGHARAHVLPPSGRTAKAPHCSRESLIVGSAGRTDLLGPTAGRACAAPVRTMRRLSTP